MSNHHKAPGAEARPRCRRPRRDRSHSVLLSAVAGALLAIGIAPVSPDAQAQDSEPMVGAVLSVSTASSLSLLMDGGEVRPVTLWGVEAPAIETVCGEAARAITEALFDGRMLACYAPPFESGTAVDATARVCAFDGDSDMAEDLTRRGLVRDCAADSFAYYASAQGAAMALQRGLWGIACPDPQAMWPRDCDLR